MWKTTALPLSPAQHVISATQGMHMHVHHFTRCLHAVSQSLLAWGKRGPQGRRFSRTLNLQKGGELGSTENLVPHLPRVHARRLNPVDRMYDAARNDASAGRRAAHFDVLDQDIAICAASHVGARGRQQQCGAKTRDARQDACGARFAACADPRATQRVLRGPAAPRMPRAPAGEMHAHPDELPASLRIARH